VHHLSERHSFLSASGGLAEPSRAGRGRSAQFVEELRLCPIGAVGRGQGTAHFISRGFRIAPGGRRRAASFGQRSNHNLFSSQAIAPPMETRGDGENGAYVDRSRSQVVPTLRRRTAVREGNRPSEVRDRAFSLRCFERGKRQADDCGSCPLSRSPRRGCGHSSTRHQAIPTKRCRMRQPKHRIQRRRRRSPEKRSRDQWRARLRISGQLTQSARSKEPTNHRSTAAARKTGRTCGLGPVSLGILESPRQSIITSRS